MSWRVRSQRAAPWQVRTPYMLVQQHDYVLARPFDLRGLLRTMARNAAVKHVRLNGLPTCGLPPRTSAEPRLLSCVPLKRGI